LLIAHLALERCDAAPLSVAVVHGMSRPDWATTIVSEQTVRKTQTRAGLMSDISTPCAGAT
jgi:hypothetical protein